MRFKQVRPDEWKIDVRFGEIGQQRRHIGEVDATDRPVYADVFLNYDSARQIHEFQFFGSPKAAKEWVRSQIETEA